MKSVFNSKSMKLKALHKQQNKLIPNYKIANKSPKKRLIKEFHYVTTPVLDYGLISYSDRELIVSHYIDRCGNTC